MSKPQKLERSAMNLGMAVALLVGGSILWIGALLRNPMALSMLPGFDGCLTAGVVGILLALLHGIPYRTALLYLAVPIIALQLMVSAAMRVSFFPMLGIELCALGLFGLPFSRMPRPAAARERVTESKSREALSHS